jgi:hypothetical protein
LERSTVEPGIHDVVVDRPERVTQTDGCAVAIPGLERATLQQNFLIRRITRRNIDLIADALIVREQVEREAAHQSHIQIEKARQVVSAEIVQIMRPAQLDGGRAPGRIPVLSPAKRPWPDIVTRKLDPPPPVDCEVTST